MFASTRTEISQITLLGLSRSGLEYLFEELSSLESAVVERKLAALAAIEALSDGGLGGADVARSKGRSSSRKAKKATKTAKKLAKMPRTRDALAKGKITEEHADSVADAAERVEDAEKADAALAETAARMPADLFEKKSREWADRNEAPAEGDSRYARQRSMRRLSTFTNRDGMLAIRGEADGQTGAEFLAALDAEVDRLWRLDGGRDPDPLTVRTPEQRRIDALTNLVLGRAGSESNAEATASARPGAHPKYQALVTIDFERYLAGPDGSGLAEMSGAGSLPRSVLERIMCDVTLAPLIVDSAGRPLWLGRSRRSATPHQWQALITRDSGCVICAASPSHCEAHHLTWWHAGGTTDITNLVLLCAHHHHLLHDHNLEIIQANGSWSLRSRARPAAAA